MSARRTSIYLISDFDSKQALRSLFLSEQENAECIRETRRADLRGGARERPLLQCVAAGNTVLQHSSVWQHSLMCCRIALNVAIFGLLKNAGDNKLLKYHTHVCETEKERVRRTDRQGKTCVERRQTHTHVEREGGGREKHKE